MFTEEDTASPKKRMEKKKSLGIDVLVVDQATLRHMIFPALLTACEDAYTRRGLNLQSSITRAAMLQSTCKMFRHF